MAFTSEQTERYTDALLSLLPKSGETMGNQRLRNELTAHLKKKFGHRLTEQEYWELRNPLITQGILAKGQGRGGTVRRVKRGPGRKSAVRSEQALYRPFMQYVTGFWVGNNDIKEHVLEKTANQGKKQTGGKWTRPDVTLIAVRTYVFTPGRTLEVTTFEVKPANQYDVAGVFETASHSVFAHKSYLAIHCPEGEPDDDEFIRFQLLCKRFGIGLLVFRDPESIDSYEELLEPERRNPDPLEIDNFIQKQISSAKQTDLMKMLK